MQSKYIWSILLMSGIIGHWLYYTLALNWFEEATRCCINRGLSGTFIWQTGVVVLWLFAAILFFKERLESNDDERQ